MDAEEIAVEIHHRRRNIYPDAAKCQAMAEAMLFLAYDITPSLDHFMNDMTLCLEDERNLKVTVIGTERINIRVDPSKVDLFDVIIFAHGYSFKTTDILGWLPTNRVRQAPQVKVSMDDFVYEVKQEFLFPLPDFEFSFAEPDTNVPRVWSYDYAAWYLPTTGTYLYSKKGAELIGRTDQELAGGSNKAGKS